MSKKIRFEITASGEIKAKTIGMNDEECLDYVEILEKLLDAETVDSEFTEEYLEARLHHRTEEFVEEKQQTKLKGE